MNKLWIDDGWADYLYWQSQDKNNLKIKIYPKN